MTAKTRAMIEAYRRLCAARWRPGMPLAGEPPEVRQAASLLWASLGEKAEAKARSRKAWLATPAGRLRAEITTSRYQIKRASRRGSPECAARWADRVIDLQGQLAALESAS